MSVIRSNVRRLAVCAVLALGVAAPVWAGQVILSDPLTSWPLNFGPQGPISLKNGAVHINAPKSSASWETYSGFSFTDMDASVSITPENTNGNAAGLLFWSTGPNDFFDFSVSDTAGTFAVYHHVSTAATPWQPVVPYTKSAFIKPGANVLRVVTKGNYVTLYDNGQTLGSLSIMAPAGGGTVGFEGEGGASGPSDYLVANLTVSQ